MVMVGANTMMLQLLVLLFLHCLLFRTKVLCYQYKVGDLDCWGIPTSANPQVYTKWSKYQNKISVGDSLLFLYPPSQDSVIQVTAESYGKCNLKDPVLYMDNGNSLFNITSEGDFYFTSGVAGHCQKNQKLHIKVGVGSSVSNSDAPSYGPTTALPENASSYPTVFGSIPTSASSTLLPLLILIPIPSLLLHIYL